METATTKTVVGKNNRRYTMTTDANGVQTIRLNCNYAGASRNMPLLKSWDGVTFRQADGGSDMFNKFITKVLDNSDLSVRFPNIVINR